MHSHYINGEWIAGEGQQLTVTDPATGSDIWTGRSAIPSEIDRACRAARAAFDAWAMRSLDERIAVCARFRDLLKASSEELALLISQEVGKPLWEARTEVTSMANKVDISVQACHVRTGITQSKIADGDAV